MENGATVLSYVVELLVECNLCHTNECVNDPKVMMIAVELLLVTLLMVECLEM